MHLNWHTKAWLTFPFCCTKELPLSSTFIYSILNDQWSPFLCLIDLLLEDYVTKDKDLNRLQWGEKREVGSECAIAVRSLLVSARAVARETNTWVGCRSRRHSPRPRFRLLQPAAILAASQKAPRNLRPHLPIAKCSITNHVHPSPSPSRHNICRCRNGPAFLSCIALMRIAVLHANSELLLCV